MVPDEIGSAQWVQGIIDWEGNSGAFEHVQSNEITDPELKKLWETGEELCAAFNSAMDDIQVYLDDHLDTEG